MSAKPKLLITGVSGLLGGNLARHLADRYDVAGVYNKNKPPIPGMRTVQKDLSYQGALQSDFFADYSPDYVVHCAGESNVDICERDPVRAERQIYSMTESVARFAQKQDAHLVCISTDAVSDGNGEYLNENDVLRPVNVYGKLKVRAENYLLSAHASSMVVRTRFYGNNIIRPRSFTEHLLREFSRGHRVECFVDNFCSHIYVLNLADILDECMQKKYFGIFNIVEDVKHSRFDFARLVASTFGFDEKLVVPSHISAKRSIAPRPADTSLSNKKIKAIIKTRIMSTAEGLAQMKKDMRRWQQP